MQTVIGIVGCGSISTIYLENLCHRFNTVRVSACADLDTERALKQDLARACPPLPERFEIEVDFLHARDAFRSRFYPGVRPVGDTTLCFTHSDLLEVMCFFNHIILFQ